MVILSSSLTGVESRGRRNVPEDAPSSASLAMNMSAVSWGAIFAGATVAAALSLILLLLGSGLGLSVVSPWATVESSATSLGTAIILWVTFTQIAASGLGGYVAGRLRTKWLMVQGDEVHFRDTAHGLLSWAVATLASAVLLSATIGAILGGGAAAAAATSSEPSSTGVAAGTEIPGTPVALAYFTDMLFRSDRTSATAPVDGPRLTSQTSIEEAMRILTANMSAEALPIEDARYLGQLVAQRTGMARQIAEQRVAETFAALQANRADAEAAAKAAAETARKAASHVALWLFISLLIGAFVASLAATYGGRQRDN